MKCTLTDHGIGVLLIVRGPGGFHGGRVIDALVSHVDIFPTLCDLLDLAPPPWLRGASLLPLVRGEAESIRDEVFAEVTYHAAYEPQRCVRTARYKYIRRFDGRERPVLPNCDDSPSKDVWLAHGGPTVRSRRRFSSIWSSIPTRRTTSPQTPECGTCLTMRGRLLRWMQATDDPLLQGPVPAPPGAVANDPDGLSPNEPTQPAEAFDHPWIPFD